MPFCYFYFVVSSVRLAIGAAKRRKNAMQKDYDIDTNHLINCS